VRGYLGAHADGVATVDDFLAALSDAAKRDVATPFRTFLDQPGLPGVRFSVAPGAPALVLEQARFVAAGASRDRSRWAVPVCVRWDDDGGNHHACTLLSDREQTWALPGASGTIRSFIPDDGARGYYRATLGADDVRRLLAPDAPIDLAERVAAVTNAAALVRRGDIEPAVVLDALPDIVRLADPPGGTRNPQLLGATLGVVEQLDATLVPDPLRPNYQRMIATFYGDPARAIGLVPTAGEGADMRLLRPDLIALVGGAGEDATLATAARPLADQWLRDRTGVEPDMVDTVLALAARRGDRALFDRMLAEAKAEKDAERREQILSAMGRFRDPAIATVALDLGISGAFDVREAFGLMLGPLTGRETREVAWRWTQAHIDPLVAAVPVLARGYIPWVAAGFCDAEHRAQAEAFFRPRVRAWPGGAHNLAMALESIDTCIATTGRMRPGVEAFLARY
jgi:alanyl aminopeptidase